VAGTSNIPSGLLADLSNRRSVLLGTCLVLLGLGSLLMSFAEGLGSLMLGISIAAIGAGGFHPQSLSILSARYPNHRGLALGIHDSSGNLGEILGPATIGILLSAMDWRGTLVVWAVPGLAIGAAYALFCKEIHAKAISRRSIGRAFYTNIATNRPVLIIFVISVFRTMGQTALLPFLSFYLYQSLGFSSGTVGLYISILLFFAAAAPSFSGWLGDRIGRKPMLSWGLVISALSIALLPVLPTGVPLAAGLAVAGISLWALRPIIFASAMEVAPRELAGTLVGFLFTGNMGLSFISPLLAGIVADSYGMGTGLAFVALFPLLGCAVAAVGFQDDGTARLNDGEKQN
jgi:MFS family permease